MGEGHVKDVPISSHAQQIYHLEVVRQQIQLQFQNPYSLTFII